VPIDFTLTPEQLRVRGDARAFARDVLSKVESATRDLPTPLARFAATFREPAATDDGSQAGGQATFALGHPETEARAVSMACRTTVVSHR
jgi:hypothetical protein